MEPNNFPSEKYPSPKITENVFCLFFLSLAIETLNTADYRSAEQYGGSFCILDHAFSYDE
jgi:hypothetical protein